MKLSLRQRWFLFWWQLRHWPHVDRLGEYFWVCTKCYGSVEKEED